MYIADQIEQENTKVKVNFGDGLCVDIVGKCMIIFVCRTGEKKALKYIYTTYPI